VLERLISLATSRLALVALVGFLLIQGYLVIRPATPTLDPKRAQASERVAQQVADALGALAGSSWSGKHVAVARLGGDEGDAIRNRLEAALPSRTNSKLVTDTMLQELRDAAAAKAARIGLATAATTDRWKRAPVTTLEDALKLGRDSGLDYVVFGAADEFRVAGEKTLLNLWVSVAQVASGAAIFHGRFPNDAGAPVDAAGSRQDVRRIGLPIVVWGLFALLLPMATWSFWTSLLDRESNLMNVLCLGFMTVVDTMLAWALMGFPMGMSSRSLVLPLAFGLAGLWNFFILNVLERRRKERRFEL